MQQQQNLAIPIAIVIAGALVAAAIYFGSAGAGVPNTNTNTNLASGDVESLPAVSANDHITGSMGAEVVIVEYTDLECPFCKQFHGTMKQVMDAYGAGGKVAWVLRNFPLSQLHPNAPSLALAAECVAELGGNTAYWSFIDRVFAEAPINTFFDFAKMDTVVRSAGVDTTQFETCFESERYRARIEKDYADAAAAGGRGTPFNVFVLKNGLSGEAETAVNNLAAQFEPGTITISKSKKHVVMSGSLPFDAIKTIIDAVL